MSIFRTLWIFLVFFTMVSIIVSLVPADNLTGSVNGTGISTNLTENLTLDADLEISDLDAPMLGTRKPVSGISLTDSNTTGTADLTEPEAKAADAETSPKYDSLGEIIAAKDWKALSEYTCKIKAENPGIVDDTPEVQRQAFRRFLSPDPPAPVQSCCGSA
jgi:hypothetical protein